MQQSVSTWCCVQKNCYVSTISEVSGSIVSDKDITFKPFGHDFLLRIHKIEEKKVVLNSENPEVVFSFFETVKLSVSIS